MTTTQNNKPIDEAFLDDAATEAIGAHVMEESDAFVRRLAQATADERRAARNLRETVARMATAAPYMEPPPALREKLLAATAPQTFNIEDYRRKGNEGGGFFRWGFAAAVLFLAGAAWFNYSLQTQVDTQNRQIATLQHEVGIRTDALVAMADPTTPKITLQQAGQACGMLLLGPKPVMFLPNTVVAEGIGANVNFELNGQKQHVLAPVIGALASEGTTAADKPKVDTELRDVTPSEQRMYKADMLQH